MPFTHPRCREAENMNSEDDEEEGKKDGGYGARDVGGEGGKEKRRGMLRSALWSPYYVQLSVSSHRVV
jgi:hypothetical protein